MIRIATFANTRTHQCYRADTLFGTDWELVIERWQPHPR